MVFVGVVLSRPIPRLKMAEFTLVTRGHKRCARRQRNRYNDPVRFDSMRETAVECNKDNAQAVYTAVLEKQ